MNLNKVTVTVTWNMLVNLRFTSGVIFAAVTGGSAAPVLYRVRTVRAPLLATLVVALNYNYRAPQKE